MKHNHPVSFYYQEKEFDEQFVHLIDLKDDQGCVFSMQV